MIFSKIVKEIFEKGAMDFNGGLAEEFENVLCEKVEYYCPEIKTENYHTPESTLHNKADVIAYFKWLYEHHKPEISNYEYIKIGKTSIVRCYYNKHHYVLNLELRFDEYGKVKKMLNSHYEGD